MSQTPAPGLPPFSGIATFGRQPCSRQTEHADVAIVGIPYDSGTSYRSGTRLGPRAIREQSLLLWGYNNSAHVAPFETLRIVDYGDIEVVPVDIRATQCAIETEIDRILATDCQVAALGGDHSVVLPLLRSHYRRFGPLAVVHLDAHSDTWDEEFAGHKYSHGTPFRRALEEGLIDPAAYVQIGIRGPTPAASDYQDARGMGARLITLDDFLDQGLPAVLKDVVQFVGNRPTYLTLDIDVVDPAFAPGTGTPEVGGLTSVQILRLVRGLQPLNVVGFDLVEVCPPHDPSHITSILAANLVFEVLSIWAHKKRAETSPLPTP